jgi:hypothetical protein
VKKSWEFFLATLKNIPNVDWYVWQFKWPPRRCV